MKQISMFCIAMVAMLFCMSFSSCTKDEVDNKSTDIIGIWQQTNSSSNLEVFIFKADGTAVYYEQYPEFIHNYDYVVDGNKSTLTLSRKGDFIYEYNIIKCNSKELVLELLSSTGNEVQNFKRISKNPLDLYLLDE